MAITDRDCGFGGSPVYPAHEPPAESVPVSDPPKLTKYPHNALDGFQNGCLLDLRVRLAIDFLKHSAAAFAGGSATHAATAALDLATELLALAEARGLVEPLPETPELNAVVRTQARRLIHFQAEQQKEAMRLQRENAGGVQVPSINVPGNMRRN